MQKQIVSTPQKGKSLNYFVYEMKDTNQLLKDLITNNIVDTVSSSRQKKEERINDQGQNRSKTLIRRQIDNTSDQRNNISNIKYIDSSFSVKQESKDFAKYQDSYQNEQNEFFTEAKNQNQQDQKQKKVDNKLEQLILQKIYLDFSENEDLDDPNRNIFHKNKGKQIDSKISDQIQSNKQTKKQKKGLANISLRVKNIVSEHKKLSYKQVSDLVLQYSKKQIDQLEESQRIKQIKNIKRRVYDALNVLVAMGILGKHQRCVCNTQWTNIPGKKHSNQWQNASKLKKSCNDKSQALKLLIDKYNAIGALRNKHQLEANQQKKSAEIKNQTDKCLQKDYKLMFPVIAFCPSLQQQEDDKLTVQIQQTENNEQKMKVSGKNIMMLGDFDCALQLNLQKYRDQGAQTKLLQELNQHANQCVKLKFPNSYPQIQQANIEDYFNDHFFDPR